MRFHGMRSAHEFRMVSPKFVPDIQKRRSWSESPVRQTDFRPEILWKPFPFRQHFAMIACERSRKNQGCEFKLVTIKTKQYEHDLLVIVQEKGMKKIVYSGHAEMKFDVLRNHGFPISRDRVTDAVEDPELTQDGYRARKIAQKTLDDAHVIRVVFEDMPDEIRIITFYPGRKARYEDSI